MILSYNYLTLEQYFFYLNKLCKVLKHNIANFFLKKIAFIKQQLLNSVKQFYFLNCKTFNSNHAEKKSAFYIYVQVFKHRKTFKTLLKVRPDSFIS